MTFIRRGKWWQMKVGMNAPVRSLVNESVRSFRRSWPTVTLKKACRRELATSIGGKTKTRFWILRVSRKKDHEWSNWT